MRKTLARAVAVLAIGSLPLCTLLPGPAFGQQAAQKHAHEHDHGKLAKHGGEIAKIGSYDAEVVHVDGKVAVYVYDDHGDDISAKVTKGDAILVVGGVSRKVPLTLGGGRLEGPLDFSTSSGDHLDVVLRLVISGKTHTGKAEVRLN